MEHQGTGRRDRDAEAAPTRPGVDRVWADHWVLCLAAAALSVALLHFRSAVDVDTWLHLRIGDELRAGERFGALPDPLVVLADRPYVPTQWLSELIGSVVFQATGMVGLHALRLVAILVLLSAVHVTARRTMAPARASGVVLLLAFTTSAAWAERPQLAGLALGAVSVLLWDRMLADGRPRWALLPLTWVWAMLHGTWAVGLGIGGVALVAALTGPEHRTRWRPVALVLAACTAVVALTPLGPGLLLEPFVVSASARAGVNEWQTPSLTNPLYLVVLGVAALVVVRALRRRPVLLSSVVFALGAAGLAVYSVRTVAFGALLLVPALMRSFPSVTSVPRGRREYRPMLVAAALMAAAPGVVWGGPSAGPLAPRVDAALADLPSGTAVAVDVAVSGWVLHAHPALRPMRDLRAEVYTAPTADAYEDFARAKAGWQGYAEAHEIRWVLAERDAALDRALSHEAGWQPVVADGDHRLWHRT